MAALVLYTIGYAPHEPEAFVALLARHGVTVLADVRSAPYSGYKPEFSKKPLAAMMEAAGLGYVFLGKELGARSEDPACLTEGRVDFDKVAAREAFKAGLDRLRRGMEAHRVALMCAEKDPLACHRFSLICRNLRGEADIRHIQADGTLESQAEAEARLLRLYDLDQPELPGLGRSDAERLDEAYRRHGRRISARPDADQETPER